MSTTTTMTSRYTDAAERWQEHRAAAADLTAQVTRIDAEGVDNLVAALLDTDADDQLADWLGVDVPAVQAWCLTVDPGVVAKIEERLTARGA